MIKISVLVLVFFLLLGCETATVAVKATSLGDPERVASLERTLSGIDWTEQERQALLNYKRAIAEMQILLLEAKRNVIGEWDTRSLLVASESMLPLYQVAVGYREDAWVAVSNHQSEFSVLDYALMQQWLDRY